MIKNSMKPAVGYIRMSTDKQEDSPEQQKAEINKLAKQEGFRIIRWYEDHGISGAKTLKRPEFRRMIRDAEDRGDFKAILCWDQDRFGRFDSIEAGEWISPLRRVGVELVTVCQGHIDWNDFAGRLIYQITQEGKNQFLVSLSNNVMRGMIKSARAGCTTGRSAYGYDKVYHDETGKLVYRVVGNGHFAKPKNWKSTLDVSTNEQEPETVRWIFDQFANTDANCESIARELNQRKVSTRNGCQWHGQSVRNLLRNPVYVGRLVFGKQPQGRFNRIGDGGVGGDGPIVIENAHPPLVDEATFQRAQEKLAKRYFPRNRSRLNDYILSGLVICGNADERMFGRRSTVGNRLQYYAVRTIPGGPEHCFAIRKDWLEPLVIKKVVEILDSPDLEQRLREAITKRVRSANKTKADCKALKQQITALDKKIAKGAERLLLLDSDDLADASSVLADWRNQRRQLIERLESLAVTNEASPERETARVAAELANLRKTFQSANPAKLRAALATVIEDITLYWGPGGPRKWRLKRGVIRFGDKLQVTLTSEKKHSKTRSKPTEPSSRSTGK